MLSPLLLGIIIIIFGFIWLLNNFGIISVSIGRLIATYWPVILIIIGLDSMGIKLRPSGGEVESRATGGSKIIGLVLAAIGGIILGRNLGLYQFDLSIIWKVFWPLLLIFIGWSLLRGASGPSGGARWAVMGGIEQKNKGWKVTDAQYFAVMGGVDLDLTMADIPPRDIRLNLTAVMGGITLVVPRDLAVECDGTAILGGVKLFNEETGGIIASRHFETPGSPETPAKLIIRGTAVMGGVEIKRG